MFDGILNTCRFIEARTILYECRQHKSRRLSKANPFSKLLIEPCVGQFTSFTIGCIYFPFALLGTKSKAKILNSHQSFPDDVHRPSFLHSPHIQPVHISISCSRLDCLAIAIHHLTSEKNIVYIFF